MSKPIDMKAAKERRQRKKYSALVLGCFDKLKHADNREIQERRAEVERKAKELL